MSEYTIYHNPRCSKSRNTLSLLQENGVQPEVVLYLESAPDARKLQLYWPSWGSPRVSWCDVASRNIKTVVSVVTPVTRPC